MRDRYIALIFLIATVALSTAEQTCEHTRGSCITYGPDGKVESCTPNGVYIERTTCFYNVCRNGNWESKSTCRDTNCQVGGRCIMNSRGYSSWEEAREICRMLPGYDLLNVEDEEIVKSLFTKHCVPKILKSFWVGGRSSSKSNPFAWTNGKPVSTSITSQVQPPRDSIFGPACLALEKASSNTHYWRDSSCSDKRSFICAMTEPCKPLICRYNGQTYNIGEVVWKSPTCECTRMICQPDGQVHLVQKEKPCCLYHDRPYGNNEVVVTGDCYQILCHKGELVSVPHCPENFTLLTYNGVASCYHVSKENYNSKEAYGHCKRLNSEMAVVSSEGENHALENHLFYNNLHGGCKNGWLGAAVRQMSPPNFKTYLTWQFGMLRGMPVASIYEDFCEPYGHCSRNVADVSNVAAVPEVILGITYTGSQETNNYCWNCTHGYELKNAICETCVSCEHRYSDVCLDCGKIYDNGEVINQETEIAPCYKKVCNHGIVEKKSIACKGSSDDTIDDPTDGFTLPPQ